MSGEQASLDQTMKDFKEGNAKGDLSCVIRDIQDEQTKNPQGFSSFLKELNKQAHKEHLLPGMRIVGTGKDMLLLESEKADTADQSVKSHDADSADQRVK